MKTIMSALVTAILFGCASNPKFEGPDETIAYFIDIDADQPGTRIEVNDEYVGDTPIRIRVWGDEDGTFHAFNNPYFTIRAMPPKAAGGYTQLKVFHCGGFIGGPGQTIPKRILFDTSLRPISRTPIEVNVY